jgi:hypothetical protein
MMRETSRWINLAPHILLRSDGPGPLGDAVGLSLGHSRHLAYREYDGAAPCASESRWVKCRDGSIGRQVSPLDGRLRMLRNTAGPTLGALDAFGVRGFEIS